MKFIAFGKNVVEGIIDSPFFTINKVIFSEAKKSNYQKLIENLHFKKTNYQILPPGLFERHIPDRKHQGVIAFIGDYNYSSLFHVMENAKRILRIPLIILLDSIEDPHNFGAIVRTCSALGVGGIIIAKKQQVPINNTVIKVSAGGISYIPVCQVSVLEEAINSLRLGGYTIVSTVCEEREDIIDFRDFQFEQPTCLIFGNEHSGIRKSVIKKSDLLVSIPMENKMNSLNVSVSCGIITAFFLANNKRGK